MKKALLLLGFAFVIAVSAFAGNTPKIKNIRVREITDGGGSTSYKVVVVVKHDDLDEVASVDVALTPASPTSPVPSALSFNLAYDGENSAKNKKRYVNRELAFGGPALGQEYDATITMRRTNGTIVGAVETIKVKVDDKADMVTDPAAVTGVRIAETSPGITDIMVFVTDPGNLVHSVRVDIIPISRTSPLPLTTTLLLPLDVQLPDLTKRFSNYGGLGFSASAVGAEYFVTITLLDVNGVDLNVSVTLSTIVL